MQRQRNYEQDLQEARNWGLLGFGAWGNGVLGFGVSG